MLVRGTSAARRKCGVRLVNKCHFQLLAGPDANEPPRVSGETHLQLVYV